MARWNSEEPIQQNVRLLGTRYKVSRFVVLRQAFDLGLLEESTYWELYEAYLNDSQPSQGESGGDFYANLLARSSSRLTSAVLSSVSQGSISYLEAARLLKVRVATLTGLASHVTQETI
jgi:Zn-dependent peptidase ImmA (M78 family)